MKLRIRGNTVRIRVSQNEMNEISSVGLTQDSAEFGPGSRLSYRVEVVSQGPISASYTEDCINVKLPRDAVDQWQSPDEVSIVGEQSLDEGGRLKILVEKDFVCLAPREGEEDEADMFPNPRRGDL